jgi:hypothetical protein
MPKFLDLTCSKCGWEVVDLFVMTVPDRIIHDQCGGEFEHLFLPASRKYSQWGDKDAVVVFRTPSGEIKYPMRNDAPTPPNCERVTMRSLREVESFERQHNVRSEFAWYDKGSGRGHDDGEPQPKTGSMSREQREAAFMRAWRG